MSDIPFIKVPKGFTCQEASIFSGTKYLPCDKPAVAIIYSSKDKRGYYMCAGCSHHNIKNRNGKWVGGDTLTEYLRKQMMYFIRDQYGDVWNEEAIRTLIQATAYRDFIQKQVHGRVLVTEAIREREDEVIHIRRERYPTDDIPEEVHAPEQLYEEDCDF